MKQNFEEFKTLVNDLQVSQ